MQQIGDVGVPRLIDPESEPRRHKDPVLHRCTIQSPHPQQLKITSVLLHLCGIGRESDLCGCATQVQEPIRVVTFPVGVGFGVVEPAQQIVRCDPAVQPFRLSRYDLDIEIAFGQLEFGRSSSVGADFSQQGVSLMIFQEAHAGGGKEENRSVLNFIFWDLLESVLEQLLQVIGADGLRGFAESRNACCPVHVA